MSSSKIKIVVRRGLKRLARSSATAKEKKRFAEIYNTVYRHARHKGQTHAQALDYCWKVYAEQAPPSSRNIINSIMSENMSVDKKQIRRMVLEMLEGEVIKMSDYQPRSQVVEPKIKLPPAPGYENFLSEMHEQMLDFMAYNFETLTPEQQLFLDETMDALEDELGIEEEASFDFGDEEVIADIDQED